MDRRQFLGSAGAALAFSLSRPGIGTATASQRTFEPLGRVPVRGAAEAVVGEAGDVAYVAATDGFATVDVSDPSNPERLAEVRSIAANHPDGPLLEILDVAVDGDRLAVPGPANRGEPTGVALFDVSDPADPVPVGDFYETAFPIHNCEFADGYLYLTGNDFSVDEGTGEFVGSIAMVVLEAGDEGPREVGRWSLVDHDERWADVPPRLRYLHDVVVRDGIAYLPHWDAGTYLVDVSDPAAPAYVAHVAEYDRETLAAFDADEARAAYVEPPGNAHYAAPNDDGTILAVGRESWAIDRNSDGGPSGIDLYDVSDPSEPESLARIEPPETADPTRSGVWTTSHNFDVVGDRLYSSWYQGGVKIHDISDPTDPEEIAAWRDPGEASFWTAELARPDEFFVSSSMAQRADGTFDGLYAFPDRAGEQPTPTETEVEVETEAETGAESTADGTAGAATPNGTETATGSGTESDADASDGDSGAPGFGAPAALVGLGLGAAAAARRLSEK